MAVFQTAGDPPSSGVVSRANNGCTMKINAALDSIAIVKTGAAARLANVDMKTPLRTRDAADKPTPLVRFSFCRPARSRATAFRRIPLDAHTRAWPDGLKFYPGGPRVPP